MNVDASDALPESASASDARARVDREHLELLAQVLRDPDYPANPLVFDGDAFRSPRTGRRFPVKDEGYVDFVGTAATHAPASQRKRGAIFRLNEYYNRHFEQRIARSIFAGGGIAAWFMDRRVREWLSDFSGVLVDVGCGDRKTESLLRGRGRYIGVDFLPVSCYSPWRHAYPDVNADALDLPLRTETVDGVVNLFVIEHVVDPARLVDELCRILKPGGTLVLAGPGDTLMSHGEPHVYFNLTSFAYRSLLERNGMVIEQDYYPSRFWVSITGLFYNYFVRNDFYNRGRGRKALQAAIFGVSLLLSPIANLLALALDFLLPFDRRGYAYYMVRARKAKVYATLNDTGQGSRSGTDE